MKSSVMRMFALALGTVLAVPAYTQTLDVKFEPITSLQPEILNVWQDSGMRSGTATPILAIIHKGRTLAEFNTWTLTDSRAVGDEVFVGFGISVPIYQDARAKISLAGGWSTALSRMTVGEVLGVRRRDGYAVGVQFLYKV